MEQRSLDAIQRLIDALPATMQEVCDRQHMSLKTFIKYRNMLREEGRIYIKKWKRTGPTGKQAAVYAMGNNKPDAPEPGPKTHVDRRAYYRKRSKDPDIREKERIRHAKRYARVRVIKKQNTLFGPLFDLIKRKQGKKATK